MLSEKLFDAPAEEGNPFTTTEERMKKYFNTNN